MEEERVAASRQHKNKKARPPLTSKTTTILDRIAKSKMANPNRKTDVLPESNIQPKFPATAAAQANKSSMYATSTIASDEEVGTSFQVPPSYKSTNPVAPQMLHHVPRPEFGNQLTNLPLPVYERKRRNSEQKKTVDLDDAFKNIKLEQDEKFADKYREDVLLARCWEIWRQGFIWIQVRGLRHHSTICVSSHLKTTHQQIGEARDKLTLKLFMQRWQQRMASKKVAEDAKVAQFQCRTVVHHFRIWQARLKQRRQASWRNDMRQKMKLVKTKSEARIKKDAWVQWRRLAAFCRADRHYQKNILIRYQTRWKTKLIQLDDMDSMADHFSEEINIRTLQKFWDMWKQGLSLRHDERIITQRVEHRIMANTLDMWRKRL